MRPKCRWKFIREHIKLLSHLKEKKADNNSTIIQTQLHEKSKTDTKFIKLSRTNWLTVFLNIILKLVNGNMSFGSQHGGHNNPGWHCDDTIFLWMDGKTLEVKFRCYSELSSSSHLLEEAGISSASWLGCNDVTSCDTSWESAIWGLWRQRTDYILMLLYFSYAVVRYRVGTRPCPYLPASSAEPGLVSIVMSWTGMM